MRADSAIGGRPRGDLRVAPAGLPVYDLKGPVLLIRIAENLKAVWMTFRRSSRVAVLVPGRAVRHGRIQDAVVILPEATHRHGASVPPVLIVFGDLFGVPMLPALHATPLAVHHSRGQQLETPMLRGKDLTDLADGLTPNDSVDRGEPASPSRWPPSGWLVCDRIVYQSAAGRATGPAACRDYLQQFGGSGDDPVDRPQRLGDRGRAVALRNVTGLGISLLLEPRETFLLWIVGHWSGRRGGHAERLADGRVSRSL